MYYFIISIRMDTILIAITAGIVANKFRMERNIKNKRQVDDYEFTNEVTENEPMDVSEEPEIKLDEPPAPAAVGTVNNPISGPLPYIPEVTTVNMATRKNDEANDKEFNEQFFPQHTRSTGVSFAKPWKMAVDNAYLVPKTDREIAFPSKEDRDDINNNKYSKMIRERGALDTQVTIHESKSKNHELPIESIQTATGSGGGIFPVLMRQKLQVLDTNPVIDGAQPIKGGFAGAEKSAQFTATENRRKGREVDYRGISSGTVSKQAGRSSVQPSATDDFIIDGVVSSGFRNKAGLFKLDKSFSVAYDEKIDTFENDITIGKQKTRSANPKAATQNNISDVTLRDAETTVPTMLGAPGGIRLKTVFKDGIFKTSAEKERLQEEMMKTKRGGASSTMAGKLDIGGAIEEREETIRDGDNFCSNMRKNDTLLKKAINNESQFEVNDNREMISSKDFTSKNFVAPIKSSNLPSSLLTNPTSSMNQVDIELKNDEDVEVKYQKTAKLVSNKMVDRSVDLETKNNSEKFASILNDRIGSKIIRKSGINLYLKRVPQLMNE